MVAQANKTETSKNRQMKKNKIITVPLYTHKPCNIKFTISINYKYLTIWHDMFA